MPRGPLPPGVYWRRRVFVLGTVAAVLFVFVSFVRGLGDDAAPPARATQAGAVTTPTTDDPTQPSQAGEADEDATGPKRTNKNGKNKNRADQGEADQGEGEDTTTPQESTPQTPVEVLPTPTGTCEDADVRISPFVLGAVAGRRVTFSLQLRTSEAVACNWRLNAKSVALKITRAGEDVWTSWQCERQVPDVSTVVRRDTTTTIDFNWSARTSTNGCGKMAAWAGAGTYQIRASTFGGVPSDEVEFELASP